MYSFDDLMDKLTPDERDWIEIQASVLIGSAMRTHEFPEWVDHEIFYDLAATDPGFVMAVIDCKTNPSQGWDEDREFTPGEAGRLGNLSDRLKWAIKATTDELLSGTTESGVARILRRKPLDPLAAHGIMES